MGMMKISLMKNGNITSLYCEDFDEAIRIAKQLKRYNDAVTVETPSHRTVYMEYR